MCAFQDRCTKHVVGGQVRADMPEALVTSALQRALLAQRTASGLMVRSDWGGQYVGNAYKTLLRGAKAQLSHSRRSDQRAKSYFPHRRKLPVRCAGHCQILIAARSVAHHLLAVPEWSS